MTRVYNEMHSAFAFLILNCWIQSLLLVVDEEVNKIEIVAHDSITHNISSVCVLEVQFCSEVQQSK